MEAFYFLLMLLVLYDLIFLSFDKQLKLIQSCEHAVNLQWRKGVWLFIFTHISLNYWMDFAEQLVESKPTHNRRSSFNIRSWRFATSTIQRYWLTWTGTFAFINWKPSKRSICKLYEKNWTQRKSFYNVVFFFKPLVTSLTVCGKAF